MAEGHGVNIYDAVIADLEAKIAQMQATVDNLRAISGGQPTVSTMTSPRNGGEMTFAHDAFFGMTVADATRKYLSTIKKTASLAAICEALVAGGWKTSSKNVSENVRAIISRQDDIIRVNGEFGLSEWYPGRKVKRSTSNAASGNTEDLLVILSKEPESSTSEALGAIPRG